MYWMILGKVCQNPKQKIEQEPVEYVDFTTATTQEEKDCIAS